MMQLREPAATVSSRKARGIAPSQRQASVRPAAAQRATAASPTTTLKNAQGEPCETADFDCRMTMSMEDEDANGALTSWVNAPGPEQQEEWAKWMKAELTEKLKGLRAETTKAEVWATGVRSASVVKGRKRANEIEFVLSIEGQHRKVHTPVVTGDMTVSLKTSNKKDQITVSPVDWVTAPNDHQVLADISFAAQSPMESALAIRLNDVLWDVEKRSLDESTARLAAM